MGQKSPLVRQPNKFGYLTSFIDCGFYFITKICGQFLDKMAEGGHTENKVELRGMGRPQ